MLCLGGGRAPRETSLGLTWGIPCGISIGRWVLGGRIPIGCFLVSSEELGIVVMLVWIVGRVRVGMDDFASLWVS